MPAGAQDIDLDELPDGIVVADADGRVTAVNATAAAMLGTTAADLVGVPLREAMSLDDLEGHRWFDCTAPYDGFELRTRLAEQLWHLPDGRELLVTARLLRDRPRGTVRRVVVSLRDARARARDDRERSDLVATVAHELRSPLTGVKGFTATLLSRWDRFSDSQRLLMLQTVDSDADRLGRLVSELLDAARIDSGRMRVRREPLDIAGTVAQVLATASAGGGREITLTSPAGLPTVWADSDRVAQVVTNLVENAQRHGAGRIDLMLSQRDRDGATGVEIRVDDQGSGVPADIRSRVFTRFWHTGTAGGSGLGLYIVRGVVEAHGGEVSIADAPGGGASVRAWLPSNDPEVPPDAGTPGTATSHG